MSMVEWLQTLEDNGRLVRVVPTLSFGDDEPRTLYVSPEVNELIHGPWVHDEAQVRGSMLRADLEFFASGSPLTVCNRPFQAQGAQIGLLSPINEGVWDVRSQARPGIRVLGQFAEKDCFLGLIAASRSKPTDYLPRGPLGGHQSKAWADAIADARRYWNSLCPMFTPVLGDDLHDYFSGNIIPV